MFHVKKHKQLHIFDPFAHIGAKRRKIPDKSWSGLFRKEILQELPVGYLCKYYHNSEDRPDKELYSMHDLTDANALLPALEDIRKHDMALDEIPPTPFTAAVKIVKKPKKIAALIL